MFGSGSCRAGVLPGEREQHQVVFHLIVLFYVPSEVVRAASDFCSGVPSGSRPRPPLELEVTVVVCSYHLQATQEVPCPP